MSDKNDDNDVVAQNSEDLTSMSVMHTQLILAWADVFLRLEKLIQEYCTDELREDIKPLFALLQDKTAGGPYKKSLASLLEESVQAKDSIDIFMDKLYMLNTVARETAMEIYDKLKQECYTMPGLILPVPLVDCFISDPDKYKHECKGETIPEDLKAYMLQDRSRFGKVVLYCQEQDELPEIDSSQEIVRQDGPWLVLAKKRNREDKQETGFSVGAQFQKLTKLMKRVLKGIETSGYVAAFVVKALVGLVSAVVNGILMILSVIEKVAKTVERVLNAVKFLGKMLFLFACLYVAYYPSAYFISPIINTLFGWMGLNSTVVEYTVLLSMTYIVSKIPVSIKDKIETKIMGGAETKNADLRDAIMKGFEEGQELFREEFPKAAEELENKWKERESAEEKGLDLAKEVVTTISTKFRQYSKQELRMKNLEFVFHWTQTLLQLERLVETTCKGKAKQKDAKEMVKKLQNVVEQKMNVEDEELNTSVLEANTEARELAIEISNILSKACGSKLGLLLPVPAIMESSQLCQGEQLPSNLKEVDYEIEDKVIYCEEKQSQVAENWIPSGYEIKYKERPWYVIRKVEEEEEQQQQQDDDDQMEPFVPTQQQTDLQELLKTMNSQAMNDEEQPIDAKSSMISKIGSKIASLFMYIVTSRPSIFIMKTIGYFLKQFYGFLKGVGRRFRWTPTLLKWWSYLLGIISILSLIGITVPASIASYITLNGYLSGLFGIVVFNILTLFIRQGAMEAKVGKIEGGAIDFRKHIIQGIRNSILFVKNKYPDIYKKLTLLVSARPTPSAKEITDSIEKASSLMKKVEQSSALQGGSLASNISEEIAKVILEHQASLGNDWIVFQAQVKSQMSKLSRDDEKEKVKKMFQPLYDTITKMLGDTNHHTKEHLTMVDFVAFVRHLKKKNDEARKLADKVNDVLSENELETCPVPYPLIDFEMDMKGKKPRLLCNGKIIPKAFVKFLLEENTLRGKHLFCTEDGDENFIDSSLNIVLKQDGWILAVRGAPNQEPANETVFKKLLDGFIFILKSPYLLTKAVILTFVKLLTSTVKFAWRHKGKILFSLLVFLLIIYMIKEGIIPANENQTNIVTDIFNRLPKNSELNNILEAYVKVPIAYIKRELENGTLIENIEWDKFVTTIRTRIPDKIIQVEYLQLVEGAAKTSLEWLKTNGQRLMDLLV